MSLVFVPLILQVVMEVNLIYPNCTFLSILPDSSSALRYIGTSAACYNLERFSNLSITSSCSIPILIL